MVSMSGCDTTVQLSVLENAPFLSVLASMTNALLQSQQNRFCGKALVWIKSNECVLGTLDLKGTLSRMCRITVEIRCVIMIGLPFPGDKGLNGCLSSFFLDSKRNSLTFWEIVSAQQGPVSDEQGNRLPRNPSYVSDGMAVPYTVYK